MKNEIEIDFETYEHIFKTFFDKHGGIKSHREMDYDFTLDGAWNTIKIYTAEDGENFYVVYRYPPKDSSGQVKVEILNSDNQSNFFYPRKIFFYSKDNRPRGRSIRLTRKRKRASN